ncbi:hypothetical protein GDO81_027822 [Engystomops pustulosus]|uniref:Transmembrane protein n=1 Tax=Engystomops pustulosus TaxID=76066 RepID=A0AAV6YJE9_ENGPU|nr:hypothetical protein GDO81_027822 [Engystomops pustulosus]
MTRVQTVVLSAGSGGLSRRVLLTLEPKTKPSGGGDSIVSLCRIHNRRCTEAPRCPDVHKQQHSRPPHTRLLLSFCSSSLFVFLFVPLFLSLYHFLVLRAELSIISIRCFVCLRRGELEI